MARRAVPFIQGNYYHVYNRGASRQSIFRSDENYLFLLQRVKRCVAEWQTTVIAYCLMPNHYHFVLRQDGECPLSSFVQAVFNSYTKAFNKMYRRSGTLFEGPFRALHVAKDEYLVHLCRYVHRNPLEAGLVTSLDDWPYSNYLEWIGRRDGALVDRRFVRGYFASPEEYTRFVVEVAPPKWMERAVRPLLCD
jgi:putative transposase